MKNHIHVSAPLGALAALTFTTLKLCHVIAWSWWFVLCPLYIVPALVICFIIAVCIIGIVCSAAVLIFLKIVNAFQRKN